MKWQSSLLNTHPSTPPMPHPSTPPMPHPSRYSYSILVCRIRFCNEKNECGFTILLRYAHAYLDDAAQIKNSAWQTRHVFNKNRFFVLAKTLYQNHISTRNCFITFQACKCILTRHNSETNHDNKPIEYIVAIYIRRG